MPKYLRQDAIIKCSHGAPGRLIVSSASQTYVINGSPMVLRRDILSATFAGCGNIGNNKKPCTKVASLLSGLATDISVDGDVPVLDTLDFITDGVPPARCGGIQNPGADSTILDEAASEIQPSDDDWDVTNLRWSNDQARNGDEVWLEASTSGLPDGTPVRARVFLYREDGEHELARRCESAVERGAIRISWNCDYEYHGEDPRAHEEDTEQSDSATAPRYFFTLFVAGRTFGEEQESDFLSVQDHLVVVVVDTATNDPIPDLKVEVTLPDGKIVEEKLDSRGRISIDTTIPGRCEIRFPDLEEANRG